MHSLAEDEDGNVWLTQYRWETSAGLAPSVGFWKADRSGVVMFPTLSLFNDSSFVCPTGYAGYTGAGITVNRENGDVWFADYCRKRMGRLRKSCPQ
jgi:hypothetical protein